MKYGTCIDKFRDKSNKIYGYRIAFSDGTVTDYNAEGLKLLIKNKELSVNNLILSSDNRLMDKNPAQRFKVGKDDNIPNTSLIDKIMDRVVKDHIRIFPNNRMHKKTETDNSFGTHYRLCSETIRLENGLRFKVILMIYDVATVFFIANATPRTETLGKYFVRHFFNSNDPERISMALMRYVGQIKEQQDKLLVEFGIVSKETNDTIENLTQQVINKANKIKQECARLPENGKELTIEIYKLNKDIFTSKQEYDKVYEEAREDVNLRLAYEIVKHITPTTSIESSLIKEYDSDPSYDEVYYTLKLDGKKYIKELYDTDFIAELEDIVSKLEKIYNWYR